MVAGGLRRGGSASRTPLVALALPLVASWPLLVVPAAGEATWRARFASPLEVPVSRLVLAVSLVLAAHLLVPGIPSLVQAQDRTRAGRSRMELSFDHGYGSGSEGEFVEIAADARVYAPFGLGLVARAGLATRLFSNALAFDLGAAYRLDLIDTPHAGLQLALAVGASVARGPFDGGEVWAFGGFSMLHLDFWHRNFFVGLGGTGHLMATTRDGSNVTDGAPRSEPIFTLTPTIRIGGEWGL